MNRYLEEVKDKVVSKSLEVEDILACVNVSDSEISYFLRSLINDFGWLRDSESENKIPYISWIETVITFLEEGYDGLKDYKSKELKGQFVLGLLESMHTDNSVYALIEIFESELTDPELDIALSKKLVTSINLLMSFDPEITIDENAKSKIRRFLHYFLNETLEDSFRANVYCALRGVGNKKSIEMIEKLPKLKGSWVGVEDISVKAIEKKK